MMQGNLLYILSQQDNIFLHNIVVSIVYNYANNILESYELHPGFIAMVQEETFSRLHSGNLYHHLREFEQLCSCLTIEGMAQKTLKWKLFPFSLNDRAKQGTLTTLGA